MQFPLKIFPLLLIFILAAILYLFKKNSREKYFYRALRQALQEKINLLGHENAGQVKENLALQEKIRRYNNLKSILEEINHNLDLGATAQSLISIAFSLIGKNTGACLLYLVDNQARAGIGLYRTKKEDKKLIIKSKEGDIFDQWVLRHTSPLLMEDIRKDFRFDLEKLEEYDSRPISSLISSPFIIDRRLLGILRLDNPRPNAYSQEDLRFLVTLCDIGAVALENGELFSRVQDLAIHDELTSLYTKTHFLERLKEECVRSRRQRSALGVLMLDIDCFKNYNDKFGHIAGDIVLKRLSGILREFLKEENPLICRFGGEEFCLALSHTDKNQARKTAQSLRAAIENTKIILRQQPTGVTVSIGVAGFPDDAQDETELIAKADQAMYKAKEAGRNRVIAC